MGYSYKIYKVSTFVIVYCKKSVQMGEHGYKPASICVKDDKGHGDIHSSNGVMD